MWDLVGNPEDLLSHNEAHFIRDDWTLLSDYFEKSIFILFVNRILFYILFHVL